MVPIREDTYDIEHTPPLSVSVRYRTVSAIALNLLDFGHLDYARAQQNRLNAVRVQSLDERWTIRKLHQNTVEYRISKTQSLCFFSAGLQARSKA
jgi:hypothetical protein